MSPSLEPGEYVLVEKFSTGIALPPLHFPFAWELAFKVFAEALRPLERGDIVLFIYPGIDGDDEGSIRKKYMPQYFIKRVVALPQEDYQFDGERLYINGKILEEEYLSAEQQSPIRPKTDPLTSTPLSEKLEKLGLFFSYAAQYGLPPKGRVPRDAVLVLGDKRSTSGDSRTFGFVPIAYITGKVIFIQDTRRAAQKFHANI